MKMILLSSLLSLMLLSIQCEKDDTSKALPECLKDKISQLEKEDCPSVGQVLRYQFQEKTVYVIHPKNCGADLTSAIVDKDCNTLCQLGGIIGNVECEGVNFIDNATNEKQVYP